MSWFGKRVHGPRPNVQRHEGRAPVRRAKSGSVRRTLRAALGAAALLLGAWTATSFYYMAGPAVASWFKIREVRVTGLQTIEQADVLERLKLTSEATLLSVSPAELEARIITHPWVKAVTVSRSPLHVLSVQIVERKPAALLKGPAATLLLDEDGAVLSSSVPDDRYDLPVVVGVDPKKLLLGDAQPREAVQRGIKLAGLLAHSLEGRPEVDMTDPSHAVAYLKGMRFQFGAQPVEEQWERYRAVEPVRRVSTTGGANDIDLRFADKVIVRERS
jgi:cell division protein FtsQ